MSFEVAQKLGLLRLGERHEQGRRLQHVLDQALAGKAVQSIPHRRDGGDDVHESRLADLDDIRRTHHCHRSRTRLARDERHLSEQRVLEQVRDILRTLGRFHEHAQLAARHEEKRFTRIALAHDHVAIFEAQDGERARHRGERFPRQLREKRQRVILLLVAHENRKIQRCTQRLLGGVLKRFGMSAITHVELRAGIYRRRPNGEPRELRRTRGVGLYQESFDLLDRLPQLHERLARHQRG